MLPTSAGVEPATSWSPVGRRIQLSHRGRQPVWKHVYLCEVSETTNKNILDPTYAHASALANLGFFFVHMRLGSFAVRRQIYFIIVEYFSWWRGYAGRSWVSIWAENHFVFLQHLHLILHPSSYSRLSLSRIPRDSLKHLEISVSRHIRVWRVRKTINWTTIFNKWICNLTPEVRNIYMK